MASGTPEVPNFRALAGPDNPSNATFIFVVYTFFFVLLISIFDDCDEVLKPGELSYTDTISFAYCLLFIVFCSF